MFKNLVTIAILLTTFSCSTMKIAVKKEFWSKKDIKIGVALTTHRKGGAHREGSEGLLDMAINSAATSGIDKHLSEIELDEFYKIRQIFVDELKKDGFSAVVIEDKINLEKFPKSKIKGKTIFDKDLTEIAKANNIDVLIVFSITKHGTLRSYWGFIPTGTPRGLFQATGQMVDLGTNDILWYREMEEKESTQTVSGEWDQDPDFPNVTKAVNMAMRNAISLLRNDFFKQ